MSRYRAPLPPSSKYITPEGKQTLLEELSYLWRVKRPEVTKSVSEAAAQGDRSENAEYIYGKKLLRQIDSRIRFLQKRMDDLTVVNHIPDDQSRVFFGAWVRLEHADGTEAEYRIVGPDEFDTKKGWISVDSPLARAILKKEEGDEVDVALPNGRETVCILDVQYEPFKHDE